MTHKTIWKLLSVFVFCVASASVVAQEQKANSVELSVAHASASPQHMAYWVASAEGFFEKRGIGVDNIRLNGGPAVLQSISSSRADIGLFSISTAIQGWALGKHVIMVAALGDRALQVPMVSTRYLQSKGVDPSTYAKSPLLARLAALKGSRWPITGAGLTDNKLRLVASKGGLDSDRDLQVTPFNGGAAATVALLRRGTFDALWAEPPLDQDLLRRNDAVLLLDPQMHNEIPKVTEALQSQIIVNSDWARKNAATLRKFDAAIVEASQFIHQQPPQRVAQGLRKEFPELSLEYLTDLVNSIKDAIPIDAKLPPDVIGINIDLALNNNPNQRRPRIGDIYTEAFLPASSGANQ